MPATEPRDDQGLRAGDLLGRTVTDAEGRDLGRVADLVVDGGIIVAVVVTRPPWGRLLGYERDQAEGPWLLEAIARRILRRDSTEIPWAQAAAVLLARR